MSIAGLNFIHLISPSKQCKYQFLNIYLGISNVISHINFANSILLDHFDLRIFCFIYPAIPASISIHLVLCAPAVTVLISSLSSSDITAFVLCSFTLSCTKKFSYRLLFPYFVMYSFEPRVYEVYKSSLLVPSCMMKDIMPLSLAVNN